MIRSATLPHHSPPDIGDLPEKLAARYVSLYWGGAMVGRFVGSAPLQWFCGLLSLTPGPPPFSAMSDVVNDSFIPKLYPQHQDSECRWWIACCFNSSQARFS
jgi:hypothetical protein